MRDDPPNLPKVIVAQDPAEGACPPSTPYRTSEAFAAIVELEVMKRENARLRSARRRPRIGVVLAIAASCMSLAMFSTVLVVRHVPASTAVPAAVIPSGAPQLLATATPEPEACADPPTAPETEGPTALDELDGDAALKPLAAEITSALLADPVLRRNPRIAAEGRARLETAVRQQLITLVDGTAEADVLDASELMWEIRPTHAEWEAATAILDKALERHKVSEANRSAIETTVASNESTAVADTALRANALARRASVGLSCPEESITSRALETTDTRIVSGCGRRAIYAYAADVNMGVSVWHREPNP